MAQTPDAAFLNLLRISMQLVNFGIHPGTEAGFWNHFGSGVVEPSPVEGIDDGPVSGFHKLSVCQHIAFVKVGAHFLSGSERMSLVHVLEPGLNWALMMEHLDHDVGRSSTDENCTCELHLIKIIK